MRAVIGKNNVIVSQCCHEGLGNYVGRFILLIALW